MQMKIEHRLNQMLKHQTKHILGTTAMESVTYKGTKQFLRQSTDYKIVKLGNQN